MIRITIPIVLSDIYCMMTYMKTIELKDLEIGHVFANGDRVTWIIRQRRFIYNLIIGVVNTSGEERKVYGKVYNSIQVKE